MPWWRATIDAASSVWQRDDEVDELYEQVYRELVTYMIADPKTIERATYLIWVAHNLERIADRATNIAEPGDLRQYGPNPHARGVVG